MSQQSGIVKHPCFICSWDSKDRPYHYKKIDWPLRNAFNPGSKKIINIPLVDPARVLLSPLHIKLGMVSALGEEDSCFIYLQG